MLTLHGDDMTEAMTAMTLDRNRARFGGEQLGQGSNASANRWLSILFPRELIEQEVG